MICKKCKSGKNIMIDNFGRRHCYDCDHKWFRAKSKPLNQKDLKDIKRAIKLNYTFPSSTKEDREWLYNWIK